MRSGSKEGYGGRSRRPPAGTRRRHALERLLSDSHAHASTAVPGQDTGENKTVKKSREKKGAKSAEANLPSDAIKTRLFDLRKRGFNRLFQNGQIFEFSTPESLLDLNFSEPVFGLVDRLVVAA
jgi:hypothetical protein